MPARLSEVLAGLNIQTPTPIQIATLPDSLAGRDVLGRGRTGSGKTYAFLLPVVARLAGRDGGQQPRRPRPRAPRALILAPTRELVNQIEESLRPLARAAGLSSCTIFGGVGQNPQVAALRRGVDIVVACPGRLEDLIAQGHCELSDIEVTVLDEADHMADLGFLPAVRRLLTKTPTGGQRLLFSATLDQAVEGLERQFLTDPVRHQADVAAAPTDTISHHVLHIEREHRLPILVDLTSAPGRTLVFTRTKHGAKALCRQLNRSGVATVELHGNLAQNARTRNLEAFHSGQAQVLVATDIAARGIHVDDVTLVVHADPPAEHKAYLHRSGRTARAGNTGTVVTLMTADQVRDVRDLTRAAGITPAITRIDGTSHPVLTELAPGERVLQGPIDLAGPAATPARVGRAPSSRRGEPQSSTSRQPASSRQSDSSQPPSTSRRSRRPSSTDHGGAAQQPAPRPTPPGRSDTTTTTDSAVSAVPRGSRNRSARRRGRTRSRHTAA